MPRKLIITNKSIERIGLPSDYKAAIIQYIWNGFEAGANQISINFIKKNDLGYINTFEIQDNGTGINFNDLEKTFGVLLDSPKQKNRYSSSIQGGKGKGRLSFQIFSDEATWNTIYENKNKLYQYSINIKNNSRDDFDTDKNSIEVHNTTTGTTVKFSGLKGITANELESEEFQDALKLEFGWFLHLNMAKKHCISINNKAIEYKTVIADSETFQEEILDKDKTKLKFKIDYIRWNERIGQDSFYYCLSENLLEKHKKHTSFNKVGGAAYGFIHSVYIQSEYFNKFEYCEKNDTQKNLLNKNNQSDSTFKKLIKKLNKYLKQKRNDFYRLGAEKQFKEFEDRKVIPKFSDNKYDQERKEDFKNVFKEIYLIEPTIFINLKPQQEKSLLGMLNLLLDSNERENILTIIESVVDDLDSNGREELANVLKKTTFSNIVRTIKMLENRFLTIEGLKTLVFDLKTFTDERNHIQSAIENNYWLFGEQFHLVSADKNFENMLSSYLYFLDENDNAEKKYTINDSEKLRRPDIFMCRQRKIPDSKSNDDEIEENILIELKRPSVNIGIKQYRQIEDYFNFILKKDEFKSKVSRKWKFFIVGNSLTQDVSNKYSSFQHEGKKFLVNKIENYEIYALTWDDLFQVFNIKHRYLIDKLNFDKTAIQEEFKLKGIELNSMSSDKITEIITN